MRTTRLDARYGRTGSRRRTVLASIAGVVVLAGGVVAWSLWSGFGSMEVDTSAFTVHGDSSVTVRWVVTGDAGSTLVCAIEAQDASGVVLGLQEVVVRPTGQAVRTGTTVVRTTRTAVTGLIDSCRDA